MPAPAALLLITGVTVIQGGSARGPVSVLIRHGMIERTGVFVPPQGATVLDGEGRFLIPGLWDMHTHVVADAETHFPQLARWGVTGIREMHTAAPDPFGRIEAARRLPDAPRIVAAGAMVDGPWPVFASALPVSDPAEARAAVRQLRRSGAAFVKTYDLLPPDAYRALLAEARSAGLPVAGHVPFLIPLGEAIEAGQRSIEHLSGLFAACSGQEHAWQRWTAAARLWYLAPQYAAAQLKQTHLWLAQGYSEQRCAPQLARMAARRVWHCPTLVVLGDLQPAGLVAVGGLHRAGVALLAGTDAGNPGSLPGESLHRELELLAQAGLTPAEALAAATTNPAAYFGSGGREGIRPGAPADLVLLAANPLEAIANTRRIVAVIRAGRIVYEAPAARRKP